MGNWLDGPRPILWGAKQLQWDRYHDYTPPTRLRSNNNSGGAGPELEQRPGGTTESPMGSAPEDQARRPARERAKGVWDLHNIRGAGAEMSESLQRGGGAFGQYDSGSSLGTAPGEGSLSNRNSPTRDGIWIGGNAGLIPELNSNDPRPVWHPNRSKGWINNAQGFRESRSGPLATDYILQSFLADKGFDPGKVDGYFGPKSKKALEEFQERAGLEATGKVDEKTREAIAQSISGQGGSTLWR